MQFKTRNLRMMLRAVLVSAIGVGVTLPAAASSEDAWQAMRQKVYTGCLAQAKSMNLGKVDVSVDPFGTQHYGTAILIKRAVSGPSNLAYVCIMDKKMGTFEVGGELPLR
jgi:hypothetical protein